MQCCCCCCFSLCNCKLFLASSFVCIPFCVCNIYGNLLLYQIKTLILVIWLNRVLLFYHFNLYHSVTLYVIILFTALVFTIVNFASHDSDLSFHKCYFLSHNYEGKYLLFYLIMTYAIISTLLYNTFYNDDCPFLLFYFTNMPYVIISTLPYSWLSHNFSLKIDFS